MEDFKYVGVLFSRDGWMDQGLVSVMRELLWLVVMKKEVNPKATLWVYAPSTFQLSSVVRRFG